MSETYVECLVKCKKSVGAIVLKWFLIILTAFFGIGRERQTLSAVAKQYKITYQAAQQIKEKALKKIRNDMESLGKLVEFLD